MTVEQALDFVRTHGIVLISANGPVPKLTESIANEPIHGSWWGHAKGREIFRVLETVKGSPDILVCRLVQGKVTLVHSRLWPALVRVAHHFAASQLAQVQEEHTALGRHVTHDVAFPEWVPSQVIAESRLLDENESLEALGPWVATAKEATRPNGIPRPNSH